MFGRSKVSKRDRNLVDLRITELEITVNEIEEIDDLLSLMLEIVGSDQKLGSFTDGDGNILKGPFEQLVKARMGNETKAREEIPKKLYEVRRLVSKVHRNLNLKAKFEKKSVRNPIIKNIIGRETHLIYPLEDVCRQASSYASNYQFEPLQEIIAKTLLPLLIEFRRILRIEAGI